MGLNLATNGNFENAPAFVANQNVSTSLLYIDGTATGTATPPAYYWVASASGSVGTVNFDSSTFHLGSQALHVKLTSTGSWIEVKNQKLNNNYATTTSEGFTLNPSCVYTLTCWMKTANMTGAANSGVGVAVLGSDSTPTQISTYVTTQITTNTDWTFYQKVFTTQATEVRGHVELRFYGHDGTGTLTGDAWFDDIQVWLNVPRPSSLRPHAFSPGIAR